MGTNSVRLGSEALDVDASNETVLTAPDRRKAEAWLAALLQSEHVSLLVGNGLSTAVGQETGAPPPQMSGNVDAGKYSNALKAHAERSAAAIGRLCNVEDQVRSALALAQGLDVVGREDRRIEVLAGLSEVMSDMVRGILEFERSLATAPPEARANALRLLRGLLLPFASRAVGRDRLNLFTTNYDRLLEYGADVVGLRMLDRFVGTLAPTFRASRLEVDMHYSPPGIRGEPRYLEGVVRLSKLHGSVDWRSVEREILRVPLPFGAGADHPEVSSDESRSVLIYPNPAKDVETLAYPYAELFRDLAGAICRPNAVLFTYGYGYGDAHINRIIADALTLSSTHLVAVSYSEIPGFEEIKAAAPTAQTTELIGSDVANLAAFVDLLPASGSFDLLEKQLRHAETVSRLSAAFASGEAHGEEEDNGDGD